MLSDFIGLVFAKEKLDKDPDESFSSGDEQLLIGEFIGLVGDGKEVMSLAGEGMAVMLSFGDEEEIK